MEFKKDTYDCKVGKMGLSQHVYKILKERCPIIQNQSENRTIGSGVSKWYCPGCGELLDKELKCTNCNKSIADVGYHLIERHPHLQEDCTWRAHKLNELIPEFWCKIQVLTSGTSRCRKKRIFLLES